MFLLLPSFLHALATLSPLHHKPFFPRTAQPCNSLVGKMAAQENSKKEDHHNEDSFPQTGIVAPPEGEELDSMGQLVFLCRRMTCWPVANKAYSRTRYSMMR